MPFHSISTATLPSSCLSSYATCGDVATAIVGSRTTYLDATCAGDPSAMCECTAVFEPPAGSTQGSGTYTASNGKLGFSTGIPARAYCVNGGQLSYAWGTQNSTAFGFAATH